MNNSSLLKALAAAAIGVLVPLAAQARLMGPANLAPEIVTRLNSEIVRILKMPDVAAKMASLGSDIVGSTPQEFATFLSAEIGKWGKVARENHIKLD
jgi:tripartite-type tricarboxylate transporter receptor subunit TctC